MKGARDFEGYRRGSVSRVGESLEIFIFALLAGLMDEKLCFSSFFFFSLFCASLFTRRWVISLFFCLLYV